MSTPWGQGRAEVSMLQKEITEAVVSGRTLSAVYDDLKQDSRISITYKSFWQNATRVLVSSNKHAQSSWGRARKEVIAQRSQIRAALSQGRALKSIYNELKAGGRVSGTYQAFHKNVNKFCTPPRPGASMARPAVTSAQSEAAVPSKAPAAAPVSNPPSPRQSPAEPPPKPGEISLMDRISGKKSLFVVNRHISRKEVEHGPD